MSEHVFEPAGNGRYLPTEHGRGPWDPGAMHGGAAAALLTGAFEAMEAGSGLPVARLSFDFVRPVPIAPLTLSTSVLREGRRVVELTGELRAGDVLVCAARALRVAAAAELAPEEAAVAEDAPLPAPDEGPPTGFTVNDAPTAGFGAAMDVRWVDGSPAPGPSALWMRLRPALVAGEPTSALQRLAATADFGNGVAAPAPWDAFVFINADLTIQLQRPPRGEWIGLRSGTHVGRGGAAMTESRLYDAAGPVGRSLQSLVLERRPG
jgi:Acyl-CoA thioesterase C-terminal domain/Acyl-CoA thioesterase N-terminal domain